MATKELITFLRERLHEDEWVAQESGGPPWTGEVPGMVYLDADAVTDRRTLLMGGGLVATTEHAAHQRHITRHDPASVLRKVTAQRKLIAMWHAADEDDDLDQRYADSYVFSPARTQITPTTGPNGGRETGRQCGASFNRSSLDRVRSLGMCRPVSVMGRSRTWRARSSGVVSPSVWFGPP